MFVLQFRDRVLQCGLEASTATWRCLQWKWALQWKEEYPYRLCERKLWRSEGCFTDELKNKSWSLEEHLAAIEGTGRGRENTWKQVFSPEEKRFPSAIAWGSQEHFLWVSAVSQALPVSAPQSSFTLTTSPTLLMWLFPWLFLRLGQAKLCSSLGWDGAGCRAVRASSRAASHPPRLLHNFLGYFKLLSGRAKHWSAAGAVNGRGRRRPSCAQARLREMDRAVLCQLLSSFPVPSSRSRKAGDWGREP